MGHEPKEIEPITVREEEAARLLGISKRKMWELGATGAVAYANYGRCKRYLLSDLRAYAERQKRQGRR